MEFDINKEGELLYVAKQIQDHFPHHRYFMLEGDLGAGKTALVKAFAATLGCEDDVNSPTFSIINEYTLPTQEKMVHMDLYRIEEEDELIELGIEEYLDRTDIYCFVEWPEKLLKLFNFSFVKVKIAVMATGRKIKLEAHDT